ncbi:MAG: class I tRNA ligase family protein, partial [Bacteroidetes bacterium]|nr:class I tRNA ligase family protein [Bacteroidota bacterium]
WWGHRIPVWYWLDADGEIDESRGFRVSIEQPEEGMVQDEDVLDTWFSSWLWPFATLGWPEKTPDLAKFYPGTVLVSGYDILFFWIARMIMAGLHFMGDIPYKDIFITGMIKDKQGRWMSKSLGNGIDPLEMTEQYGADAVRFSLTILCAQGQDIKLDPTKFEMGRNFANKIWNAFNVFGQFMEEGKDYRRKRSFAELDFAEQWMLTRLGQTILDVEEDLARYRLNEGLGKIYTLFWGDYCDWYLELIKPQSGEPMSEERIALAVELFETMLQLLHPFMPFITEELWTHVRPREEGDICMTSAWPTANKADMDAGVAGHFATVQELISGIRNVRAQYAVSPSQDISAVLQLEPGLVAAVEGHREYFAKLARVTDLEVRTGGSRPAASSSVVVGRNQVFVPLKGMIDLDVERERLQKEIDEKTRYHKSIEGKLSNEQFVSRAPEAVVQTERDKLVEVMAEIKRLQASLDELA